MKGSVFAGVDSPAGFCEGTTGSKSCRLFILESATMVTCEYPGCERDGTKRTVRDFGNRLKPELNAFVCDMHWNPLGVFEKTRLIRAIIRSRVAERN